MRTDLCEFIRLGIIGQLRLGMTREQTASALGLPAAWLGKPPSIGLQAHTPGESPIWFYYKGGAGIDFGELDVAAQIHIYTDKVSRDEAAFSSWPFERVPKMADLRNWLLKSNIQFYEEMDPTETPYILADRRCIAICSSYENGRLLHPDERPVTMITTVSSARLLPTHLPSHQRVD